MKASREWGRLDQRHADALWYAERLLQPAVLEDTPKVKHVVGARCALLSATDSGSRRSGTGHRTIAVVSVRWPRQVLAEFGRQLPADVEIRGRFESEDALHRDAGAPGRDRWLERGSWPRS